MSHARLLEEELECILAKTREQDDKMSIMKEEMDEQEQLVRMLRANVENQESTLKARCLRM
jgi:peptidoglycan hydrolase CwlO-like protein